MVDQVSVERLRAIAALLQRLEGRTQQGLWQPTLLGEDNSTFEQAIYEASSLLARGPGSLRRYASQLDQLVQTTRNPLDHATTLESLRRTRALILAASNDLETYQPPEPGRAAAQPPALETLKAVLSRFHLFVTELSRSGQLPKAFAPTEDNGMQVLTYAILRLHFDDVRREEYVPSYAGANSRCDFLLKQERLVLELKRTRPNRSTSQLGQELLVDRQRYASHPDCDHLLCFIYDPEFLIENPAGLARDLVGSTQRPSVSVVISPPRN